MPRSVGAIRRRGVYASKMVIIFPMVLLSAWMAAEIGLLLRAAGQARNAADAAALAAAARFEDGPEWAVDDGVAAAAANRGPNGPIVLLVAEGPAGGGDLEFGDWDEGDRVFTPGEGGVAVRATVRFTADHPNGPVGLIYPGFLSTGLAPIVRSSVAVFNPRRNTTSLLVLLGEGPPSIDLRGRASLQSRGGISVRNEAERAVAIVGEAALAAPILRIAGSLDPSDEGGVEGAIAIGMAIPADPFSSEPLPPLVASKAVKIVHANTGKTEVTAGVHESLEVAGGRVVLRPGLHQFSGTLRIVGDAVLELDAATIHLLPGASLVVDGDAAIVGSPSLSPGPWSGRWILQRGSPAEWMIASGGSISVEGQIYAPESSLLLSGDAILQTGTAILSAIVMEDDASIELQEEIAALAEAGVPGRARLVR